MSLIRLKKAEKNQSYRVGIHWGELKDRTSEKREVSHEHIRRNEYDVSSALKEQSNEGSAENYLNEYGGMCGFATGVDYIKKHSNIRDMSVSESKTLFERLDEDELFRQQILASSDMDECMEIIEAYGLPCTRGEAASEIDKFRKENILSDEASLFSLWGNRISCIKK
ncbi:MAG: Nif11 family protein [Chlorobiaceae bacterium]|jgi:hypothetical protein|nr:Nif11 family protein [Chlorobiaceae bacterium]